MTQGYLLEVRIGVGEPASIALLPGTPLDPTSFGRSAMWRIAAEGVLDVHGYVYFDGGSLFVQSADLQFPVLVNRHRVGVAWTEIHAPSTLFVGQAQIVLKVTDTLARSGALVAIRPGELLSAPPAAPPVPKGPWDGSSVSNRDTLEPAPPIPAAGNPAPFQRGAFVPRRDGESTRVAPLGPGPGPAPTPPSPFGPSAQTSPVIPVPIPLSVAAPAPPKKQSSLGEWAKREWYATSVPKRILFVLSPLVVASYFSLLSDDEPKKGTKGSASASASSPSSVVTAPTNPPPALDAATLGVVPPVLPTGPEPSSLDAGKASARSLERAAADAYAQGNLPLALQLYERLARERPENPAFERSAKIIRDRLDAGR